MSKKLIPNKDMWLEKVVPNIEGIPARIVKGHTQVKLKKGQMVSPMHIHSDIELLCIFSGTFGTTLADGSEYMAYPGDVIFINSNVPHSTFAGDSEMLKHGLIQFKVDAFKKNEFNIDGYLSTVFQSKGEPIRIFSNDELTKYCSFLFDHEKDSNPCRNLYLTSGIYGVIAVLYKTGLLFDETDGVDKAKIKKLIPAFEFISSRYNENISLNDVSEACGMSSYYFCRLFKNTLGMGFTDYLNSLRVSHAAETLTETDKSILETALENGFSSVSYFNRIFKASKNCSPTEYRRFSKEAMQILEK